MEWFRSRERFRRWEEEEMILRREMATVIFDFEYRRNQWEQRARGSPAKDGLGYQAYCCKQAALWLELRIDAFNRVKSRLMVSSSNRD